MDCRVDSYTGELCFKLNSDPEYRKLLVPPPRLRNTRLRRDRTLRSIVVTLTRGATCQCGQTLSFRHFDVELKKSGHATLS